VDKGDIDRLLGIIEDRVKSRQTGAQWMLNSFDKICKDGNKNLALVSITSAMSKRQQEGKPVHTWELVSEKENQVWQSQFQTIEQIMQTELFTVQEDDPIDLVRQLMKWRNVRHIPVENNEGELSGIISCKSFLFHENNPNTAKEAMIIPKITIQPSILTSEAIKLLEKSNTECLPVVLGKHLVGLVTERDFIVIAAKHLIHNPLNRPD